jgi:3-isopropylmalate/(R)-2-methylmalate dehydratase large subunit
VLATQTLLLKQSKTMEVRVEGDLGPGVTAKDLILHIIGTVIGTAGGTGHVIEYRGAGVRGDEHRGPPDRLQHEHRGGARAGLIAPDEKTFAYLKGRPYGPQGRGLGQGGRLLAHAAHRSGRGFDKSVVIDAADVEPTVTWGTSPEDVVPIGGVRARSRRASPTLQAAGRAQQPRLHGPGARHPDDRGAEVQNVFIGSCTNSRIEDLRAAAAVLKGRRKAANVKWAIVVPGSGLVKAQAEAEGLDKVFTEAGLEWREPGCSACLGMNPDKVPPGERCASTSNRNFVGRQGPGARTHLVSPAMAAAAAVTGG